MNLAKNILLLLIFLCTALSLIIMTAFALFLQDRLVFDIDKARNEYITDTHYFIKLACLEGVSKFAVERSKLTMKEYHDKFDMTPHTFCDNFLKAREDYILEQASRLGKRKPWERCN